jgi:hypothetical protein
LVKYPGVILPGTAGTKEVVADRLTQDRVVRVLGYGALDERERPIWAREGDEDMRFIPRSNLWRRFSLGAFSIGVLRGE